MVPLEEPTLQQAILREMKKEGLVKSGHLCEAGPQAEELVRGVWQRVAGKLKIPPEVLEYLQRGIINLYCGTPGGGTDHFSKLLTNCGKRCGHESVFRAGGDICFRRVKDHGGAWRECSGFASPWLSLLTQISPIGLVRHPVGAANSMITHLKWPAERAIAYWTNTHDRDWPIVVRIEDCHRHVADVTGRHIEHVEHIASRTPRNSRQERNRRAHTKNQEPEGPITWTSLPLQTRYVAINRYGYVDGGIEG